MVDIIARGRGEWHVYGYGYRYSNIRQFDIAVFMCQQYYDCASKTSNDKYVQCFTINNTQNTVNTSWYTTIFVLT